MESDEEKDLWYNLSRKPIHNPWRNLKGCEPVNLTLSKHHNNILLHLWKLMETVKIRIADKTLHLTPLPPFGALPLPSVTKKYTGFEIGQALIEHIEIKITSNMGGNEIVKYHSTSAAPRQVFQTNHVHGWTYAVCYADKEDEEEENEYTSENFQKNWNEEGPHEMEEVD